jgi:signal transduction histidine kinase
VILGLQNRLQRLDLPPEAGDLVAATLAAARRGGTLLDRIAAISGPRELRLQPVALGPFLADLALMARPTLGEGIRLTVLPGAPEGRYLLDAGALQDALLNLVLNARDGIGPGPGQISIRAGRLRDTWLELTVEDTGSGFSEAALDHGLDPFFSTKGDAGSGLGLSMVYDHVKLAGGAIRLGNRPGGGARVVLRLPLRPAAAAPSDPPEPELVLLVEDRAEIRTEVREMLRAMGHTVIEADSGTEALSLADLPGIGLILSDIGLPGGMTGVDLEIGRAHV